MNNKEISWIYSWPVIILTLIFFFPLGLFLLVKREMSKEKARILLKNILFAIEISCYLIALLLFALSVLIEMSASSVFSVVCSVVAGFIIHILSKSMKNNIQNIEEKPSSRVYQEAKTIVQESQDIQQDIKVEFQQNVQWNFEEDQIFDGEFMNNFFKDIQTIQTDSTRVVECENCGANNTISGERGECEYCGSSIQ